MMSTDIDSETSATFSDGSIARILCYSLSEEGKYKLGGVLWHTMTSNNRMYTY